jgi:hypothetical protein
MDPSREELLDLKLDGVMKVVEAQLAAGPLEVNIAGDVDPAELDDLILRYLGTATPGGAAFVEPPAAAPPLTLEPLSLKQVAPGDMV